MKSATVIIWDYDLDTDGLNAALAKYVMPHRYARCFWENETMLIP